MLELKIDTDTYTCEGHWNELSRKRLLGLMGILAQPIMEGKRMLHIATFMLNLRKKREVRKFVYKTPVRWVHHICTAPECLGWVRAEGELLTTYVLRHFWHRYIYYSGPPKRMLHIPLEEMVYCRMALMRYHKLRTDAAVCEIVATLYRPINPLWWVKVWSKEWNGDKRLPLNEYTLRRRARRMAKLSPAVKLAVLKQFTGAIAVMEEQHPLVFKKGDGEAGENPKLWVELLFTMSGGIFGNKRQTELTACTEVFMKMEQDIANNLKQKDRLKA